MENAPMESVIVTNLPDGVVPFVKFPDVQGLVKTAQVTDSVTAPRRNASVILVGQASAATNPTAQGHPIVLTVESVTQQLAPLHNARTVSQGGWALPAMTAVCTVTLKAAFANVTLALPEVDARANVRAVVNV